MKFEIYKTPAPAGLLSLASSGQSGWRWRLRADNGKIIASGESYDRKDDCLLVIGLIMDTTRKTPIVETTS